MNSWMLLLMVVGSLTPAAAAAITVTVTGTSLQIKVQGPTGTTDTIHWTVRMKTIECTA